VYPHPLERLTAALGRHALDAVVVSSAANLAYLTGAARTPRAGRPPVLAVMGPSGVALVVAAAEAGDDEPAAGAVDRVVPYGSDGPGAGVAAAVEAVGSRDGAVGLDTGGLEPAQARAIAAALGGREVVEGSGVLLEARQVKGPWEIETIERALLAAEQGLNEVVQRLDAGMTELEATALFEAEVSRRGATPHLSRIAFGEGTARLTAPPSARRLRAGDLVRLDVGSCIDGYHADVARTGVLGPAGPRESSVVEALEHGVDAAIASMRAGVRAGTVAGATIEAVRAAGLPHYAIPSVGHGIGLDVREPPALEPSSDAPLEAEMVLVIDLPFVEEGGAGARLTETVLVSRRSARSLNRSQRGLLVL
jgi:Xaa-Pro aminopeptidase